MLFAETHWILAKTYFKMANEPMKSMNRKTIDESKCFKITYFIGIAVCAAIPAAAWYFSVKQIEVWKSGGNSLRIHILAAVFGGGVQVLYAVIGILLVLCLLVINKLIGELPSQ